MTVKKFSLEENKESKRIIGFLKKHKLPFVLVVCAILAICIAITVILGVKSAKIKDGLEGKIFITDENSVFGIQLYSFKNGKIAIEKWQNNGEVSGDISSFESEYKVEASLFGNKAWIKVSPRSGYLFNEICVALGSDGQVITYKYTDKTADWHNISLEEAEKARKIHMCVEHDFAETITIKEATCTSAGEEKQICANCGYEMTTSKTVPHNYENGVCTECGVEQPAPKSDIEADTWYVYTPLDLLKFQNCVIYKAIPAGTKGIMVQYFSVCKECHAIENNGERPRAAAPEVNYPIVKLYHCKKCGETTYVRLEIIQ